MVVAKPRHAFIYGSMISYSVRIECCKGHSKCDKWMH